MSLTYCGKFSLLQTHNIDNILLQEEFEDTKGILRMRKAKKDRQHNGKKSPKGQQRSTKHYK